MRLIVESIIFLRFMMSNFMLYLLLMVGCCEFSLYSMDVRRYCDIVIGAVCRPGDVHVYMNHSNILLGDQKKIKAISTLGLRGCFVNVVYMKNDDMDQQIIMTHYHPGLLKEHGDELNKQLGKISADKYNYAHSIMIYPYGRSFFKKNEQDLAEEFKRGNKEYLQCELINSHKTYNFLQSIVREKLEIQKLDTSFIPYTLAPVIVNGIPPAAEVHVTLSHTVNNPSLCQIRDAYDRKLYCDNVFNLEVPMFDRDEKQRERLILVCPENIK
jgi:hypothetical protein